MPFGKASEGTSAEASNSKSETARRSGIIEAEFEGSDDVKYPELKWFANDDTIKRLIEIRTNDRNQIKSETLILEGSLSATMSQKTACAIDGAIGKIGASTKASMEGQATKENHSKMIFKVEF